MWVGDVDDFRCVLQVGASTAAGIQHEFLGKLVTVVIAGAIFEQLTKALRERMIDSNDKLLCKAAVASAIHNASILKVPTNSSSKDQLRPEIPAA
jgi:hypothetical protein